MVRKEKRGYIKEIERMSAKERATIQFVGNRGALGEYREIH